MEEYNAVSIKKLRIWAYDVDNIRSEMADYNINSDFGYRKFDELLDFDELGKSTICYAFFENEIHADDIIVKTYFRFQEPRFDYMAGTYRPSFNFATDKQEIGVSVISEEWLMSTKSVFFNREKYLKNRDVWKIDGVQIGFGGDDEPLIYPVSFAKKTSISTLNGLLKAIKNS